MEYIHSVNEYKGYLRRMLLSRKERSFCFSGNRSEKLPQSKEKLEQLQVKLHDEMEK